MGLLKILRLRLELRQGVGFTALPNGFLHRSQFPGAEPDLLLAGGECGLLVGVSGGEGAVEIGDCRLLWGRRERRHDLADAEFRRLLLDFEDIGNWVLEFC